MNSRYFHSLPLGQYDGSVGYYKVFKSCELAELCDVTVAVTAPEEDRVRRLMARDGISGEYARSRIAAQHNDAWFREKCDYVLVNDGELDAFATKCVAFLRELGIMDL